MFILRKQYNYSVLSERHLHVITPTLKLKFSLKNPKENTQLPETRKSFLFSLLVTPSIRDNVNQGLLFKLQPLNSGI